MTNQSWEPQIAEELLDNMKKEIQGDYEMKEDIKVGDLVTPISDRCGLWLADTPVNGDYYQKRNDVCVFKGVGKVLKVHKIIIDYDEWDEQDKINGIGDSFSVGKLEYLDFLIECDAGTGWGGGVIKLKEKTK